MKAKLENSFTYKISSVPVNEMVYMNNVFLHPDDYKKLKVESGAKGKIYLAINNYIITAKEAPEVSKGNICLSKIFRDMLQIPSQGDLTVQYYCDTVLPNNHLAMVKIDLTIAKKNIMYTNSAQVVEEKEIEEEFKKRYLETTINKNHFLPLEIKGANVILKVTEILLAQSGIPELDNAKINRNFGLLIQDSVIEFNVTKESQKDFKIKSDKLKEKQIFKQQFNFEEMGIGGLDSQFSDIFRIAFVSRRYPAEYLAKMNVKHIKGMLLYGPPGTGKTLIARQLGKALRAKEPKIVNGPEIFDKFVGKSEENIRELFKDAEKEFKEKGDESDLHIIIFDEIDAICRPRGSVSSGTGVNESVVNQLLSKIDGVDALNNILIIGMTNRKDMIDEAILRPGRLSLHVEIGLPNVDGRFQILSIHTKTMKENKILEEDVNLKKLAELTKNYTGAEIEELVKRAASFALNRGVDMKNLNAPVKYDQKVTADDFDKALEEIKPQFGTDVNYLDSFLQFGIIEYGESFVSMYKRLQTLVDQVKFSKNTNLLSVLLEGEYGTGKTAIACDIAKKSGFPFVKIISPETLVGFTESGKVERIFKIFEDAYKSPLSMVIIDNIERIIEFIKIGPRFSNLVLQTILVYVKRIPIEKNRKLMIIGTTSMSHILQELEVTHAFNVKLSIQTLNSHDEIMFVLNKYEGSQEDKEKIAQDLSFIPIKQLLLIIDMTKQFGNGVLVYENFKEAYKFFLNR